MKDSFKLCTLFASTLILLRITVHYSELGFIEFLIFEFFPGFFILFLPLAIVVYRVYKGHKLVKSIYDFLVSIVGYLIIFEILSCNNLDKLDWFMNYEKRKEIVKLAKKGELRKLRSDVFEIPNDLKLWPFIKGDEIRVINHDGNGITLLFYTSRGIMDHYSGFVYTNNLTDISNYSKSDKLGYSLTKIESNWYFMHE